MHGTGTTDGLDHEVALATYQALVEDNSAQHSVEFTELSNAEVIFLATVLADGRDKFRDHGRDRPAQSILNLETDLQEQVPELFEQLAELDDGSLQDADTGSFTKRMRAFIYNGAPGAQVAMGAINIAVAGGLLFSLPTFLMSSFIFVLAMTGAIASGATLLFTGITRLFA